MGEYAEERLAWEMGRAGVPGYGRRSPRYRHAPAAIVQYPEFRVDGLRFAGFDTGMLDFVPAGKLRAYNGVRITRSLGSRAFIRTPVRYPAELAERAGASIDDLREVARFWIDWQQTLPSLLPQGHIWRVIA